MRKQGLFAIKVILTVIASALAISAVREGISFIGTHGLTGTAFGFGHLIVGAVLFAISCCLMLWFIWWALPSE